jgi:uncharacterized membrane protein HdeD (DUF308 family)
MSVNFSTVDRLSEQDRKRLTRVWWLPLVIGVAWLILALVVLQFDIGSARTISWIFGLVLLAAGINEFVDIAIAPGWGWLRAIVGVVFVVGGIAALFWPDATFMVLANLIGWFLFIKGTFDIITSLSLRHELDLWGLYLAVGVLEVAVALWVVAYPTARLGAVLLVLWVGLTAVARGVTSLIVAFQTRALGREIAALEAPAVPEQAGSQEPGRAHRSS